MQWVIRPETPRAASRRYAGTMAGGTVHPGDEVVVLPGGSRTTVTAVETYDGPLDAASPPDSITVSSPTTSTSAAAR